MVMNRKKHRGQRWVYTPEKDKESNVNDLEHKMTTQKKRTTRG
jgi:hypothetical protein